MTTLTTHPQAAQSSTRRPSLTTQSNGINAVHPDWRHLTSTRKPRLVRLSGTVDVRPADWRRATRNTRPVKPTKQVRRNALQVRPARQPARANRPATAQAANRPGNERVTVRPAGSNPAATGIQNRLRAADQAHLRRAAARRRRGVVRIVELIAAGFLGASVLMVSLIGISMVSHLSVAGALSPTPGQPTVSGVANPVDSVAPSYTPQCAPAGVDDSSGCIEAILRAIDSRQRAEGLPSMKLPAGFASLDTARQLVVAIDEGRAEHGLPRFSTVSNALSADARVGIRDGGDPPAPRGNYSTSLGEWADGVSNGLDAYYLFMYDDGYGGPNTDCTTPGDASCWGHRDGILADYGPGRLEIGAASQVSGPDVAVAVTMAAV